MTSGFSVRIPSCTPTNVGYSPSCPLGAKTALSWSRPWHGLVRQEGSTSHHVSGERCHHHVVFVHCFAFQWRGQKTWCLSLGLRGHHHHRTGEPKVLLHRIRYRMPPSPCGSQPSNCCERFDIWKETDIASDLCRILDNNGLMLGLRAQIEERLVMN